MAVERHLHRRTDRGQDAFGLLRRVVGQLVGPGGVFGVDPGRGRVRPRFGHDGGHGERAVQGACRLEGEMQWCGAALARQVADDDGHGTFWADAETALPRPWLSALWWRPHRK